MTRSFGKGKRFIVIEDIPYVFCPRCGERYFTATTLREVERLESEAATLARRRPVPVISFGSAA